MVGGSEAMVALPTIFPMVVKQGMVDDEDLQMEKQEKNFKNKGWLFSFLGC